MIEYPRVVLHSEPAFDYSTHMRQPTPGVLMHFIHLDVFDWCPSTRRKMLAMWPELRARLPPLVFCQGAVDDSRFERFLRPFNWQYLSDCICTDGKNRRIFVHRRP